ncbi:hypothetical protein [Pantoea agglomerans]|uniref:hypothetical protein n=1 Tax=Enterobacter agglomerans TaxID=549 RepID=UPI0037C73B28
MKKTSHTGLRTFLALVLFSAVFQIRAEMSVLQVQDTPTVSTTLKAADSPAILRVSCLGGNSLFISLAVPSGSLDAGTLRVSGPGRDDTEWIADGQSGRSVNIAYAATPRSLVRGLITRRARRLVFTVSSGIGHTFETPGLPGWLEALPAACR